MNKPKTKEYAAKEFLQNYVKENNIKSIAELFNKDTLIEFSYNSDWEWSIKDEMEINNCSEEEAIKRTRDWYMSMSKEEIFYERTSDFSKNCLIVDKAEELRFKWED